MVDSNLTKRTQRVTINITEATTVNIPIMKNVESVAVAYPKNLPSNFSYENNALTVCFTAPFSARFFELSLKR